MKLDITLHLCDEDRGLFIGIFRKLTSIREAMTMISLEVQGLMDQSKKSSDTLASMDLRFKAMLIQMAALQNTVTALRAGAVMTDAEKQSIVSLTGELAANVSNAQADILANTPDAPAPVADPADKPASGAAPADTSGAAPVADPADKPASGAAPASTDPTTKTVS